MTGFSHVHAGVVGETNNQSLTDHYGTAGLEGFDESVDGGQLNAGVEGGTTGGTGVFGFSTFGNGVRGITTNPSSNNGQHRAAVFGIDSSTDGGGLNFGLAALAPGPGSPGSVSRRPPLQARLSLPPWLRFARTAERRSKRWTDSRRVTIS